MSYIKAYGIWLLFLALYLFIAEHAFSSAILSPPGGNPTIGGPVVSGQDKSVLFVNPIGTLDEDNPNFIYDKATGMLEAPDLTLSSLSGGACYVDGSAQVQSETYLSLSRGGTGIDSSSVTNGQLLIGGSTLNDFALATITGTANQVNVTNGVHSIVLSTPQDIATSSDVQFNKVTTNTVQATGSGGLAIRANSGTLVATAGAGGGAQLVVEGSLESNTSLILQDPGVGTNSVTIQAPTLGSSYSMTLPTANGAGFLKNNGSGVLSFSSVGLGSSDVSGTLAVGNGGTGVTSLSNILGTTNQVSVSGGTGRVIGGDVTLSLPQNIDTSAAVQFQTALLSSGSLAYVDVNKTGADSASFTIENQGATAGVKIGTTSPADLLVVTDNTERLRLLSTGEALFQSSFRFEETGAGSNYVALVAPASISTDHTITLPAATNTVIGQTLAASNTAGTLEWRSPRTTQTFTGTTVTATDAFNQTWKYTGGSAQTLATLTTTSLPDGARITFIGTSDSNTLTIPASLVWAQNGDIVLYQGTVIEYEFISGTGLVEVSRNGI